MKNIKKIWIFALMALLCCGCSKKEEKQDGFVIYYLDAKEAKLVSENYDIQETETEKMVDSFLKKLSRKSSELTNVKPIPDDVELKSYELNTNGELNLYFNEGYSVLSGVNEILRRAAIVKTLCQIEGIKSVQFFVDGQPLADSSATVIGYMTGEDFIDNTGGETAYWQQAEVSLYFASSNGKSLVEIPIILNYNAMMPMEQMVLEQLIEGPYNIEGVEEGEADVLPTVPSGTQVKKITIKEGTCYVDFDETFLKKPSDISAEVAIYSVVNSLVELANINKVSFTINGETVEYYKDDIKLNQTFERNLDLLQEQEEVEE